MDKPLVTMSPTFFKTFKDCGRKAYLDAMRDEPNIHFAYGHAYGHAAAQLFINIDKPKKVRIGAAFAAMYSQSFPFEQLEEQYANKTLDTLVKGIMASDYSAQYLNRVYEFVDEEVKIILVVKRKDGTSYILSGTYDLRLKNRITGEFDIFDFKAVTSNYLYSWETDPQIPIYTILNQVVSDKLGWGDKFSYQGKYLIHLTKFTESLFQTRRLNPAFWKYQVRNVFLDFMKSASDEALRLHRFNDGADLVKSVPVNPYICNKNDYACTYYQDCNTSSFSLVDRVDTRTPTKIYTVEVTEEEIHTSLDKMLARFNIKLETTDTSEIMSDSEFDDVLGVDDSSISDADVDSLLNDDDDLMAGII